MLIVGVLGLLGFLLVWSIRLVKLLLIKLIFIIIVKLLRLYLYWVIVVRLLKEVLLYIVVLVLIVIDLEVL